MDYSVTLSMLGEVINDFAKIGTAIVVVWIAYKIINVLRR